MIFRIYLFKRQIPRKDEESMRILIVEDEKDIANAYRIALTSKGHEVIVTFDGAECVERYKKEHNFDVVVIDYKIPVMNGVETAKEIISFNPDQKIVFISAYVKDFIWHEMTSISKNVLVLQKPISVKFFIEMIESPKISN